jgi:hypothetical protein
MANMQSARTVERGEYRIAAYATGAEQSYHGRREPVANEYGGLFGFHAGARSELQIRFHRIQFTEDDDGYNFTSIGPKIGAVEDILAVALPIGFYWGADIDALQTFQVHPGLQLTAPLNKYLEVNTAGKFILPLNTDMQKWGVVNIGLGLSSDTSRWALLPEVGFAWNLSESDAASLFSYGVALAFYPQSSSASVSEP